MSTRAKTIYTVFSVIVFAGAALTAAVLKGSSTQEVIASFSTHLAPRSQPQRHNITRAAGRLDGTVIKPGEEFSFNRIIGLCGVEQGYELAPAIVAGETINTWGGGVCQVSSTLYNAALLANLKITERHPHSRRVSSVPPGRDATTAFGVSDLRFVNTTGSPIRIKTSASSNRLTISLLGNPHAKTSVEVFTQSAGQTRTPQGRQGHIDSVYTEQTVLTYRTVQQPDGATHRELLSTDTYSGAAPSPAIVR